MPTLPPSLRHPLRSLLWPLLLLPLLLSCGTRRHTVSDRARQAYSRPYEAPATEMRAAWFPTVTRSDLSQMSQTAMQRYFISVLDSLQRLHFNALFFQVRPEADAWYISPYEPWSRFFTGTQGKAPEPYWDPLAFLIRECHRRHIELHAWINPYRAAANADRPLAPNHPARLHPDWVIRYGRALILDPGHPDVRRYTIQVITDIVARYDVDGIHLDDYFYPYPLPGVRFDDHATYMRESGGTIPLADWRRQSVSALIRDLATAIHTTKPHVRLGISPFGIYRNAADHPDGSNTRGLRNYDDLYADILLWDQMGWVDYIVPQLYWEMGHKAADYTELAYWWQKHLHHAHYYIGQSVRRTMDQHQLHPKMVITASVARGQVMWPVTDILSDYGGIATQLRTQYWRYPALIPPTPLPPHLKDFPEPTRGATILTADRVQELVWMDDLQMPQGLQTKHYVIYAYPKGTKESEQLLPHNILTITSQTKYRLPDLGGKHRVGITITRVDRFNRQTIIAHDIKAKL